VLQNVYILVLHDADIDRNEDIMTSVTLCIRVQQHSSAKNTCASQIVPNISQGSVVTNLTSGRILKTALGKVIDKSIVNSQQPMTWYFHYRVNPVYSMYGWRILHKITQQYLYRKYIHVYCVICTTKLPNVTLGTAYDWVETW